ncbi:MULTISPECIES: hypothetical protein [Mycolicibacterium]|nr:MULTISPECIES: hypothetical protein [Mycolicibacterium]MDR7291424.1 hypothetical protein [Mycolicibacterium senegalense]
MASRRAVRAAWRSLTLRVSTVGAARRVSMVVIADRNPQMWRY